MKTPTKEQISEMRKILCVGFGMPYELLFGENKIQENQLWLA